MRENGITVYITKQTYANATKDQAFYAGQFKYDPTKNAYLCPAGKELHYYRIRKKDGKIIGYEYRNDAACRKCEFKGRCTKAKKGRSFLPFTKLISIVKSYFFGKDVY